MRVFNESFVFFALSLRKRSDASENAHFRCTLSIFLPESPCRFPADIFGARDQPGIGDEVLDRGNADQIMDLVEDDQG